MTIGEKFELHNNRTSGFDYLRILLAIGVIFWHGSVVVYGHEFDRELAATWFGSVSRLLLPMFFALSGFLVAGSLIRSNSLVNYVSFRVLRIFPALIVEISLSAIVLGGLITTLPIRDYYTEGEFFRYLGNVVGIFYVFLPGVFVDNPSRWVNISLWTVPYELECYVVLLGLALFGMVKRSAVFIGIVILAHFALALEGVFSESGAAINRVPPRELVVCFLSGVLIFLVRHKLPGDLRLALVALALSFVFVDQMGMLVYLLPIPVAYATVVLGIQTPKRLPLIFSGDYSYGLYLYAFPFQQLQMYLFPGNTSWAINIGWTLVCAGAFAYFSWTFIEKPILQRRKRLTLGLENGLNALWKRGDKQRKL